MAKQQPGFGFTGSLHSVSAYKRKVMDTILIRAKGGPSKTMINSHPSFDLTRRNSSFPLPPQMNSSPAGPDNYRDGPSQPRRIGNLLTFIHGYKMPVRPVIRAGKYNDSCMMLRRYCFVPSQTAEQHQQQKYKECC